MQKYLSEVIFITDFFLSVNRTSSPNKGFSLDSMYALEFLSFHVCKLCFNVLFSPKDVNNAPAILEYPEFVTVSAKLNGKQCIPRFCRKMNCLHDFMFWHLCTSSLIIIDFLGCGCSMLYCSYFIFSWAYFWHLYHPYAWENSMFFGV